MAHVEFFGDLEGVFRAKSELVTSLPAAGLAVLNADDTRVIRMADLAPCPVLTYGIEAAADVRATGVTLNDDLQASFTLQTPWGSQAVSLGLHGAVQVANALAAAATALWCGVPLDAVAQALSEVGASTLRMDVRHPRPGPGTGRGLLQRQPGLHRGGLAFTGCPRPSGPRWPCWVAWPSWATRRPAQHQRHGHARTPARPARGGLPDRSVRARLRS